MHFFSALITQAVYIYKTQCQPLGGLWCQAKGAVCPSFYTLLGGNFHLNDY